MIDALRTRLEKSRNIFSRRVIRHAVEACLAEGPFDKVITEGCAFTRVNIASAKYGITFPDAPSKVVPVRADGLVLGRGLLF